MGVLHYGCTTIDGDTTPWCSTQTDANDDHVSGVGAWGYCDASCPYQGWLKQDDSKSALDPIHSSFLRDWREWIWIRPNHWIRLWINRHRIRLWVFSNHVFQFFLTCNSRSSCSAVSGPAEGSACVFPFTFMGVSHFGCTTIDGDTTPWCSTQTDANDDHVSGVGAWGYCDASCPVQGKEKTQCPC